MRIGFISDTHNEVQRCAVAISLLHDQGVDAFIHCGDFVDPKVLRLFDGFRAWFVFGNNDADVVPKLRSVGEEIGAVCLQWGGEVTLAGKRIAVTHGHLHLESRPLLTAEPDYFVCGHSHVAVDRMHGMTRWINPGALYRAESYSVAVLDLNCDAVRFLDVPR